MPMDFLYRNALDNVTAITENSGTATAGWGTANVRDNNLNSAFRSNTDSGTNSLIFRWGSSIYVDSIVIVNNLTNSGTALLYNGTVGTTSGQLITAIPVDGLGTCVKLFSNTKLVHDSSDISGIADRGVYIGPYNNGVSSSSVELHQKIITSFPGTTTEGSHVTVGCYVKQNELDAGFVGLRTDSAGWIYGTATSIGTWQWVTISDHMRETYDVSISFMARLQNSGVSYDGFKAVLGQTITPTVLSDGTSGLALNGDYSDWTGGTVAGTQGPDNWASSYSHGVPIVTVDGTGIVTLDTGGACMLKFAGLTGLGQHQINECFIGKRKTITEMPSYPFESGIEEDSVDLVSERGQRWVYHHSNRDFWNFNFEAVNNTTYTDLFKIYRYLQKNTKPFWLVIDNSKPQDIKYVRFRNDAFEYSEVTKNVYDIELGIEQEL